jgi:hypothetical protein
MKTKREKAYNYLLDKIVEYLKIMQDCKAEVSEDVEGWVADLLDTISCRLEQIEKYHGDKE